MLIEYLEHLKQLNNRLIRNGIVLPVNFDCDVNHLSAQVNVLEQFLYFNQVLKVSDSDCKIESLLDFDDIGLNEFLRNEIYERYEVDWNKKLLELTQQPDDAGIVDKPITVLSRREIELYTESLGLQKEEEIKQEDNTEFIPIWGSSSQSFSFDDDEDEEEEEDYDSDDIDYSDDSQLEFDDDEDEEDDYDDYDYSDESSSLVLF